MHRNARKYLQTKGKQRIIRSTIDQRKANMSNNETIESGYKIGSSPVAGTSFPSEWGREPGSRAVSAQNSGADAAESESRKMKFPVVIRHRGEKAKIHGKTPARPIDDHIEVSTAKSVFIRAVAHYQCFDCHALFFVRWQLWNMDTAGRVFMCSAFVDPNETAEYRRENV
jgi:hypothetical protein